MRATMLLALALSGCATTEGYTPHATSQINTPLADVGVLLKVRWSSNGTISERCGPNKFACATMGSKEVPYSVIWTERPASWDDHRRVCSLGHEVLHSLGARH